MLRLLGATNVLMHETIRIMNMCHLHQSNCSMQIEWLENYWSLHKHIVISSLCSTVRVNAILCRFVKQDQVVVARLETAGVICLEAFQDFPRMARFILRDEGQ